jgi:hypothetical protein
MEGGRLDRRRRQDKESDRVKSVSVAILWAQGPVEANVEVVNGKLKSLAVVQGRGKAAAGCVKTASADPVRLDVRVDEARVESGANATVVRVGAGEKSFSFFLRDVTSADPVFLAAFGAAVVPSADKRTYGQIEEACARGTCVPSGRPSRRSPKRPTSALVPAAGT